MTEKMPAAAEAEMWLNWTKKNYDNKYDTTPLETRLTMGRAWIELARIEADIAIAHINAAKQGAEND